MAVTASVVLALLYSTLGGPGDQLDHYAQASDLIPFTHNWYGPLYFVVLRLVQAATGLEWFVVGKLVSLISAVVVLVLATRFFDRTCASDEKALAICLFALSPVFISESYASHNMMFGFAVLLPAILLLLRADTAWQWVATGVLFGLAGLVRFQAIGFALGALVGALVIPRPSLSRGVRAIAMLAGFVLPLMLWRMLLLAIQGFAPANYNFIHLTLGLGDFKSFQDVPDIIERYGSTLGVLKSKPTAIISIGVFALRRAIVFPFREAFELFFVPAGFLLAGLASQRASVHLRSPWFWSMGAALALTGIGSRGWLLYYLPILPLCAVLIATAVSTIARESMHRRILSLLVVALFVPWSAARVVAELGDRNWTEFGAVREHLARNDDGGAVSSTAGSLPYGTGLRFIDHTHLLRDSQVDSLAAILRAKGVTRLVVSERHTLFEFPSMRPLVEEAGSVNWPGLRLDTLIGVRHRAAIYTVLP
jgi:hypothetical protein